MSEQFLPTDVSRCDGELPHAAAGECPRKTSCMRFLAMVDDALEPPMGKAPPVASGMCADGKDYYIGVAA